MKNKTNLLFLIVLLLILMSISYGISLNKTKQTINTTETIEKKLKKINHYKKENLSRYINYYNDNNKLNLSKVITNVNIGLDNPFYTNIKEVKNLNTITILVNKYNYLPKNYIPNNLETINTKYANTGMQLVKEAKEAFEDMSEDAAYENLKIIAMSTYRSYDYQNTLYTNYVNQDGQAEADTYSARPGHSEHQTGLAVDVYNKISSYTDFEQTKEFAWMQENAYRYGFILRYPKDKTNETGYQYESWHYRYVGLEMAEYIHKNNITYDEYYVKYLDN